MKYKKMQGIHPTKHIIRGFEIIVILSRLSADSEGDRVIITILPLQLL